MPRQQAQQDGVVDRWERLHNLIPLSITH
jgi:hypothetical protein